MSYRVLPLTMIGYWVLLCDNYEDVTALSCNDNYDYRSYKPNYLVILCICMCQVVS